MKKVWLALCALAIFTMPLSVSAATVTCEIKSVDGSTIVLKNCSQKRAQDFKEGDRVKVKLDKKKK